MAPVLGLVCKFFFSVLLWPLAGCLAWVLAAAMARLPWSQDRLLAFSSGFGAYLAVQIFFWRPLFMYVMGHELTHALAAVLQGGRADDLQVSSRGGRVKVSVSNFLVALAPYFFPIYTFVVVLVYWIADPKFHLPLLFALGVSLAFHLALTAFSLREHQSDIEEVGWLFAFPFIGIANLLIIAFLMSVCVPGHFMFKNYLIETGQAVQWVARTVISAL
jgi:hypothetical protein